MTNGKEFYKKHYMTVASIIKALAVHRGCIIFLLSLWLSFLSHWKRDLFEGQHFFFVNIFLELAQPLVCIIFVSHIIYVHYTSGTMWNQLFFNKKKSQCEWLRRCLLVSIYWVSARLLLLHSSTAWSSSSCGRFGSAGFVQSCSTPSGGNTEEVPHFCKPSQTGGGECWLRESLCAWVLLCIAPPCFCVLWFCNGRDMCVCVHVWWWRVVGGTRTDTWLL